MNHTITLAALFVLAGCHRSQSADMPEGGSAETVEAVPNEASAAMEPEFVAPGATTVESEREAPSRQNPEGAATDAILDALLGERGCRFILGKLEGRWRVGPESESEIWEFSNERVQIERGERREMRTLVAHSSIALELRDPATRSSRRLVLAQDDDAVHFGEGVGGNKTPLGFLIATPDHHLLVSAERCVAYDVDQCQWQESAARYRCDIDEEEETLTFQRLGGDEGEPTVLLLGSGVAVDRALRPAVLRSAR